MKGKESIYVCVAMKRTLYRVWMRKIWGGGSPGKSYAIFQTHIFCHGCVAAEVILAIVL